MAAGQPKKFNSGKKLIELFSEFCNYITDDADYTVIPSQTEFCKWLSENYEPVDRRTIYNALHKYFPTIKKEFEQLQSDVIAQGGMIGKYQNTMSIFVLKNWCNWKDKAEAEVIHNNGILDELNKYFEGKCAK
jgi:hypothetical protein